QPGDEAERGAVGGRGQRQDGRAGLADLLDAHLRRRVERDALDIPGRGLQLAAQQAQQGGLAGAVGAGEAGPAGAEVEVEVAQERLGVAREGERRAGRAEGRRGGRHERLRKVGRGGRGNGGRTRFSGARSALESGPWWRRRVSTVREARN